MAYRAVFDSTHQQSQQLGVWERGTISLRPIWATEWNPVSKKNTYYVEYRRIYNIPSQEKKILWYICVHRNTENTTMFYKMNKTTVTK